MGVFLSNFIGLSCPNALWIGDGQVGQVIGVKDERTGGFERDSG